MTGWMVRLGADEIDGALLATHVAGEPLPAANGSPVRLVAPGRRGLDWIKWVERVDVGDRPSPPVSRRRSARIER